MKYHFYAAIAIFLSACSLNNTRVDDSLKKYFDKHQTEGTFALLNNQTGHITLYNLTMDTQQYTPAFTFNIVNTMVGVEAAQVTSPNNRWLINGDSISLAQAWEQQSAPFFAEMARRSGGTVIQTYLDSLSYGNQKIGGELDQFWKNGTLKISPDEQLGLLFQLYFDKLPFSRFAHEMVRGLMLEEKNEKYEFAYVNGSAMNQALPIDWSMGWIEENKHVYFFVALSRGKEGENLNGKSFEIAKEILTDMEFFKGVK